jgi:hypothetical protein
VLKYVARASAAIAFTSAAFWLLPDAVRLVLEGFPEDTGLVSVCLTVGRERQNIRFRLNISIRYFFVMLLVDFIEDTSDTEYAGAGLSIDVRGAAALVVEAFGEVDIVMGDVRSRVASKGI